MFPQRPPKPSQELIKSSILSAVEVAHEAKLNGTHPFGSVLLSPTNEILLKQGNMDTLNHAELTLCRTAASKYSPEYLWQCTLVTNFEPCLMCFGAIYWCNIGRVIYGATEAQLLSLTGDDGENMTFDLSCREVVKHGQKDIEIYGPVEELTNVICEDHLSFWNSTH